MAIEDNKDYTLKGSQVKDLARRVKESTSDISSLESAVAGKQDALTVTQLTAVNSGIDAAKVAQIATSASDIDSIEEKIPTEASALNKLADKAFVDNAVTIDSISVNGVAQTPDANKNVDLTITSPTVVQTIGDSTTDVMSQKATTDMVWDANRENVVIKSANNSHTNSGTSSVLISPGLNGYFDRNGATAVGYDTVVHSAYGTATGFNANIGSNANNCTAIGTRAGCQGDGNVAIGYYAQGPYGLKGVVSFEKATLGNTTGYNDSAYMLLRGVYDGQSAHDAATKGQLDSLITMTDTDPGEGATLAANHFIAYYE